MNEFDLSELLEMPKALGGVDEEPIRIAEEIMRMHQTPKKVDSRERQRK